MMISNWKNPFDLYVFYKSIQRFKGVDHADSRSQTILVFIQIR